MLIELELDDIIRMKKVHPCGSYEYNPLMLPELEINHIVRLRKSHPCGSYEWTVTRLGADIGLECRGCNRRIMLTRRELARRLKVILPKDEQSNE